MVDTVSRVQVDYVVTGLETANASYDRIAQAERRLQQATAASAAGNSALASSQLGVQRSLDGFTRGLDPASKALSTYERGLSLANKAVAQGIPLTDAHTRALAAAKAKWEDATKGANDNAAAVTKHGHGMLNASIGAAELEHSLRSMADVMAAGGSVMTAFELEAGRLLEVAGSQGGLSGAFSTLTGRFKGIATGALELLTPVTAVAGAFIAVGAAAAYAGVSWEAGQEKLAASMEGVGRRAGETLGQLNAVAAAGARAGGISLGQGQDLAAQYTLAGLDAGSAQALIGSTRSYARFTDSSVGDAGSALASAFADPAKGLGELDKQLGFVSGKLRSEVQDLEAQGQLQAAQRLAVDAFNQAMSHVTDTTWGASRAFDAVKNVLSNALLATGHVIDKAIFGEAKSKTPAEAAEEARQANAIANSGRADDVVRAILPDLVRAQTATNNIALLRSALSDPSVLDNMKMLPGQTQQAYGNAVVMQANASPALRQRQDYELALASADAFSVAEKAAVEARRAELTVLRETGDLTRAQAAAQMAVNEAIAKSNSDAEDRLGMAKQDRALVGLSPYERGLQQIRNRYEGYGGQFSKDAGDDADFKSNLSESLKPVARDLVSAGQVIANAIRQAAATIAPAAGAFVAGGATLGSFDYGQGAPAGSALGRAPIGIRGMIDAASAQTGVPASIIAAVGEKENGFRLTGGTSLLGSDGRPSSAYGFGQLTNGAAADVARAVPGFNKYDPTTAVFGSAEYLKILAQRNGGDMTAALNAYGGTDGYAADIARRTGGGPLTITRSANDNVAPIASTALASDRGAMAENIAGYNQEQIEGPLKAANQALQDQIALLDRQKATVGQSAAAITAAAKAQDLLNTYTNADPNHKLGAAAWDQITAGVDKYRDSLQATLQAQQDFQKSQQQVIGALDGVRDATRNGLGTFVDDLEKGKSAGSALRDVMEGLGKSLQNAGLNAITNSLFGNSGQQGGGLFGGLLGRLFGGLGGGGGDPLSILPHFAAGTDNAPGGPSLVGEKGPEIVNLPRGAQVVPNNAIGRTGHTIQIGGPNITVQGDVSEKNMAMINQAVARGQQETLAQVTRNLQTISSANQQYAA